MARKDQGRAGLITCGEVRDRLYPLLMRAIAERERLEVLHHLSLCDACRLTVEAVRGRLERIDAVVTPAEVETAPRRAPLRRRRFWLVGLPLFAVGASYALLIQQGLQLARYRYERRFVDRLQKALILYRDDFGRFPPSAGAPLTVYLATREKAGPYLDLARERIDAAGHFVDRWGNRYLYRSPGIHNPRLFDLLSFGSNGRDDGGRGDDIANWE